MHITKKTVKLASAAHLGDGGHYLLEAHVLLSTCFLTLACTLQGLSAMFIRVAFTILQGKGEQG